MGSVQGMMHSYGEWVPDQDLAWSLSGYSDMDSVEVSKREVAEIYANWHKGKNFPE